MGQTAGLPRRVWAGAARETRNSWRDAGAKAPLCRVGRSMNLLKQVEPLQKAALQASSLQRHAHHAASRLTWVNIGSTSHPPSRAKQGTQTLGTILAVLGSGFKVAIGGRRVCSRFTP